MENKTFEQAQSEFFATMRALRKKQLALLQEYAVRLASRKGETLQKLLEK